MLNVTARKKGGDKGSPGDSQGVAKAFYHQGGLGFPALSSEIFKTMVWKWASEQIECMEGSLWRVLLLVILFIHSTNG